MANWNFTHVKQDYCITIFAGILVFPAFFNLLKKELLGEIEIDPNDISSEEIIRKLKDISDLGAKNPGIIEFMARISFARVNKMFLSTSKDLMQSYAFAEGMVGALGTNGKNTNMTYQSFSGLKGAEILDEMESCIPKVISDLSDLLNGRTNGKNKTQKDL